MTGNQGRGDKWRGSWVPGGGWRRLSGGDRGEKEPTTLQGGQKSGAVRVSWGPPLVSQPLQRLVCGFGLSGEVGRQGRIHGVQSRPRVSGPSAVATLPP